MGFMVAMSAHADIWLMRRDGVKPSQCYLSKPRCIESISGQMYIRKRISLAFLTSLRDFIDFIKYIILIYIKLQSNLFSTIRFVRPSVL